MNEQTAILVLVGAIILMLTSAWLGYDAGLAEGIRRHCNLEELFARSVRQIRDHNKTRS